MQIDKYLITEIKQARKHRKCTVCAVKPATYFAHMYELDNVWSCEPCLEEVKDYLKEMNDSYREFLKRQN